MIKTTILSLALATAITAHTAAWAPGMYCRGGNDTSVDNQNTNLAVNPLYDHTKEDWWFQHDRGCDAVPPPAGEFLELPANGEFTVELAHNRAFTTLSYEGKQVSDWPDGGDHPDNWDAGLKADGSRECLTDGALHTTNQSTQGATAWAISYESDMAKVTMENLVVFSTLDHTPWKRLAMYKVPDLQSCPEGGCMCAWLWIPNGCGEGNMYVFSYPFCPLIYILSPFLTDMNSKVHARFQVQSNQRIAYGSAAGCSPNPHLLRRRPVEMR